MSGYNALMRFARPFVQMLWPVKIIDKYKFKEGKGVYICNHYSFFDTNHFATDLFRGRFNVLVKQEAMQAGVAKKFLTYMGGIPVNREETDVRAIKNCMTVLKQDKPLIVFPEGTRNKSFSKKMLEIKDGPVVFALKSKAPIYPFMYYSPVKIFRKTYMIVGDPIDLSVFYGKPINEVRAEATAFVNEQMCELREKLDDIVENKDKLKQVLEHDKIEQKKIKERNKQAKKMAKRARKGAKKAKIEQE